MRTALAILYAREHYQEDSLRVEDLARAVFLSRSHFSRTFRKENGLTPEKYLQRVRMEAAADLLASTNLTVSDIMVAVGYRSVGTAISVFGVWYSCTPSEYRVSHQKGAICS